MNYWSARLLTSIALAGFLFCLLSALGITDFMCLTKGCEVYHGYSVAGISFYWIGGAVFLLLGMVSLLSVHYRLLTILTSLALAGNFVFLIIPLMICPCTSCLIVSGFLGSFAWWLERHVKSHLKILCVIWLVLFLSNFLFLAKESIPPWPIMGKNNAEIEVFFSPTSPSCRQVVENFLKTPDLSPHVAFYPIASDDNDRKLIQLLSQNLMQGMNPAEAFALYLSKDNTLLPLDNVKCDWTLALKLWRNQVYFAKKGFVQVPLIISRIPLGTGSVNPIKADKGYFTTDYGICKDESLKAEPLTDPFAPLLK